MNLTSKLCMSPPVSPVMQIESCDSIEAALVFAAESGEWDIRSSDIVTVRPSQYPTVPVGEVDTSTDTGIYAALDRGVPLSVVMAVAACR
jgi:hypothetical protein